MVNAGRMRHLVRIEKRTSVQDATGEPELVWEILAERRAELVASTGREVFSQGREGRVPTLFRMRFLDGVLPQMRLLYDERVFNILSAVDPDGRGAELLVTTEELVGEDA